MAHTSSGILIKVIRSLREPAAPRHSLQCPEREALTEAVRLAISTLLKLRNAELEAVIAGDYGTQESTRVQQKKVRDLKELLEGRLRAHISNHGCGLFR
jgi:hypothetical protein